MIIFPCRVFSATFEGAQELIIALLLKHGLEPLKPPQPKQLTIMNHEDEYWWECYPKCKPKK